MSKKLLAAVLALSLVMSLLFVPAAAATTFDDVAEDHWAASSIEKWAGYGVLTGHGDGTFTPDVVMTRAEFAAMLVKMLGLTAKSESSFTDTADHWAADFISIAVKAGIINGVGDNKFDPDEPVSFEQAAVMMCRAFGLAKNTSGDDWSKESIEKLTSLGMIGEGADEHLQVGVECNRAVVAKLADTMVAEYVAEDRATPITGEVKGVVLVVKGAKAEIKDATLAAPVVAESASVTLTNTKADAVIVSGKDAAVTADEQSTVASVTLAGEAPKADIKGEVASVTVAEETKGAVIEAPKAADNAIVNNSGTDITVNGETVSNKADDTPNNPTDTANSGTTITSDHKHTWTYADGNQTGTWTHKKTCSGYNANPKTCLVKPVTETCTIVYEQTVADGVAKHIKKCSVCGQSVTEAHSFVNGVCACGLKGSTPTASGEGVPAHTHVWAVKDGDEANQAATCLTAGKQVYKCTCTSVEGNQTPFTCQATMTVDIPALGHTYGAVVNAQGENAPTCVKAGKGTKTCTRAGCTNETNGHVVTVDVPALGHTYNDGEVTTPATCKAAGVMTYTCNNCNAQTTGHTKTEVIPIKAHEAAETWQHNDTQHWHLCKNGCGTTKLNIGSHSWGNGWSNWTADEDDETKEVRTRTCTGCGRVETETRNVTPEEPAAHVHNWSTWYTDDADNHWKNCTAGNCPVTDNTQKDSYGPHQFGNGNEAGVQACTCGKTKQCSISAQHSSLSAGQSCSECHYAVPEDNG